MKVVIQITVAFTISLRLQYIDNWLFSLSPSFSSCSNIFIHPHDVAAVASTLKNLGNAYMNLVRLTKSVLSWRRRLLVSLHHHRLSYNDISPHHYHLLLHNNLQITDIFYYQLSLVKPPLINEPQKLKLKRQNHTFEQQ